MNKQHDLHLNKSMKIALKPLLFASCMILTFPQSFADTASKDMLNELSAEANNTKMVNKQSESKEEDPTESLQKDSSEAVAGDELSAKIEKQLRSVLGKPDEGEGETSAADRSSTETELEKIVSSSLLEGAKMDDIRSAVDDAMSEIKKEKENEKAIAPERITEADKAFSKLTVKKTSPSKPVDKADTKVETQSKSADSGSTTSTIVQTTPTVLPETVTVQSGESLYKIALRLYGDGDKFLKLYEANKENIPDPNLLLAGQVLTVPK